MRFVIQITFLKLPLKSEWR